MATLGKLEKLLDGADDAIDKAAKFVEAATVQLENNEKVTDGIGLREIAGGTRAAKLQLAKSFNSLRTAGRSVKAAASDVARIGDNNASKKDAQAALDDSVQVEPMAKHIEDAAEAGGKTLGTIAFIYGPISGVVAEMAQTCKKLENIRDQMMALVPERKKTGERIAGIGVKHFTSQ